MRSSVVEFAGDQFHRARIGIEVRLLAGDLQMAAAREIAIDLFLGHELFDAIDRRQRSRIHGARSFHAITSGKRLRAELHAGQHHAAIA